MTPGFKRNPGSQPEETKGKRVEVLLVNGRRHEWSADTSNWIRQGWDFNIEEYRIL